MITKKNVFYEFIRTTEIWLSNKRRCIMEYGIKEMNEKLFWCCEE